MSGHGGHGKKGGHEEGGGHAPMWIVSFADMVILLMSFFVLLLCQGQQKSEVDENLLKIIASCKLGFGWRPSPFSDSKVDAAAMQLLQQTDKGPFAAGLSIKSPATKGSQLRERETWTQAQSTIGQPIRFNRGSDVVNRQNTEVLREIGAALVSHYRDIIVQGHCSEDEARRDPLGGHDLSFRRAIAVKRALEAAGISPSRITPVSRGCVDSVDIRNLIDRQLAVVTVGGYFLPWDKSTVGDILQQTAEGSASHGGSSHGH